MLLNCTNHPYSIWTDRQREAAACQYGEVVDLPLPQIGPLWDSDRIRSEVDAYASRIESFQADAVLAAGEFTFVFMLVDKLLEDGVKGICSCSNRDTVEVRTPDGSNEKRSVFVFEQFRPYTRYHDEQA